MKYFIARAHLAAARSFRLRGSPFCIVLLNWAANARRRESALPAQKELFS